MVFAAIIWLMIPSNINIVDSDEQFNAQFFPKIIVSSMFILSLILTIITVVRKSGRIIEIDTKKEGKILLYTVALVIYIWGITKIGFVFSSIILSAFSISFLGGKKVYLLVMTTIILFVYFTFRYLLGISLPSCLI